jgi:hypothetical protein
MLFPTPTAAPPRSERDGPTVITRYSVRACVEPGIMPRVLELFAKRGLVPQQWRSTVSHAGLAIEVEIAGLDDELAEYIARTMRQIIGVETVLSGEVGSEYKTGHAYLRSGGKAEHASCQQGFR